MANDSFLGASDLQGFQQSTLQNDPYAMGGSIIGQMRPNISQMSPGAGIATSFGQSFLAGLLSNYGQQRTNSQLSSVLNILPQLQSDPYGTQAPEGVNSGAFDILRGTQALKNYERQGMLGDKRQDDLRALMGKILPDLVSSRQIDIGDAVAAFESGDYSQLAGQRVTTDSGSIPIDGMEGGMLQEIDAATQYLIGKGTNPQQASVTARDIYSAKQAQLKLAYQDLGDTVKETNAMRSLYEGLDDAVSRSGNTGSLGGARNTGARLLGEIGFEGQEAKAGAGELLDSYSSDLVRAARESGSGPMSDKDVKLYLSSGPRLTTSESGNQEILGRFKKMLSLQDKYVDFMYDQQLNGISKVKADKDWNDLRRENPYLINSDGGKAINPFWDDSNDILQSASINQPGLADGLIVDSGAGLPMIQKQGKDGLMYNVQPLGDGRFEVLGVVK